MHPLKHANNNVPTLSASQIIYQFRPYIVNLLHYQNTPMQYTQIISVVNIENFHLKIFFLIFVQNIDYGYTLESNPQSMFCIKNKATRYTPLNPTFTIQKWGLKWGYITWTCFHIRGSYRSGHFIWNLLNEPSLSLINFI